MTPLLPDRKDHSVLKRVVFDESGRVLILVLIVLGIGALLIPVFLSHASTNLLATRITEEGLKEQYAADAGVEYAIRRIIDDDGDCPEDTPFDTPTLVNGMLVTVTVATEGEDICKITSIATSADGSSTTIISYVEYTLPLPPMFDYAAVSLNGDIVLEGSARIYSENYPELDGDVYANGGNITVRGGARIDGDATATGEIITEWGGAINGDQNPGADPLPDLDAQKGEMDAMIAKWKAAAQNVQCAQCAACGDYTHTNWENKPAGTYGRVHASGYMKIGDWHDEPFRFTDTVCAGTYININWSAREVIFEGSVKAGQDLNIVGSEVVTFKGPVCVGQDLNIQSGSGEVIFEGPVIVGGNLDIGGGRPVTFESTVCVGQLLEIGGSGNLTFGGAVKVGGNLDIGGDRPTALNDTVYVEGNMTSGSGQDVSLAGTVYVRGNIVMGGDTEFQGSKMIVAEGNIALAGSSAKLNLEDVPCIISLGDWVSFSGDACVSAAVVYAPDADITLSESGKVYGTLVGKTVSMGGAAIIEYPLKLRDREEGGLRIHTYNIGQQ